jgi:hypothetical protein
MACRSVSSFMSRDVGLWACDAAANRAASNLYSGVGAAPRRQFDKTFRRLNIEVVAFN